MPTTRNRVYVYLTDEEKMWLDVLAGREGSGVSALLRRLVREYALAKGMTEEEKE